PSHIDMFDPKPDAVAEIRGEFGTIPTTLPGVRIADQLPLLSRQTDKFSIIRGHVPMSESHGTADSVIMTGRKQTALITWRSQSAFHEQAYNLITSPAAKKAFDLSQESERTRAAYGRHRLGQSCLLARRLIEAGVHFVTVSNGDWDTHNDHFARLKGKNPSAPTRDDAELLPRLDSAYSALLSDLSARGLLETTLVVWC